MEIIEKAPAKINLGLDVLYKREMDGYHELEMVMSSVDLADRLIFEEIPENKILIETNKAFYPLINEIMCTRLPRSSNNVTVSRKA